MPILDLRDKAALLNNEDNPLLKRLKKLDPGVDTDMALLKALTDQGLLKNEKNITAKGFEKVDKVHLAYGISGQALADWITGSETQEPNRRKIRTLCERASHVARILGVSLSGNGTLEITPNDFETLSKFEFGALLGYSWQDVQRIVDEQIWRKSLPSTGIYLDETAAKSLINDYVGFYHVYHQSPMGAEPEIAVLRSAMRVRYKFKIKKNTYIVRCKLHIPRIHHTNEAPTATEQYYEYGGVLVRKDELSYWFFELPGDRPDYATMITSDKGRLYGDGKYEKPLEGLYMSVTRYGAMYASEVLIKRQDVNRFDNTTPEGLEVVHQFMRKEGPRVFQRGNKKDEGDLVSQLGKEAGYFDKDNNRPACVPGNLLCVTRKP